MSEPHRTKELPSQTAGPYVHIGLAPSTAGLKTGPADLGTKIAGPQMHGSRIAVRGRVFDGAGAVVTDFMMEVWQADAKGHHHTKDHPAAGGLGWGRVVPDFETGDFSFETVKPGAVLCASRQPQAPHLNLWLVARGINLGLNTRMYFSDSADQNAQDPVLNSIALPERRATLIAQQKADHYRFDIHLQGPQETVFFAV
ncbi:MAG: protocatechuate 3,4-dioxygenase subunit alpha [Roseobacter sp.]|jgi:protocatechuate 3,4-dioxygenase alpha subunit|nr:protocatechuate 3,4-dioxygenase subunit alpha [Roseobacter sp.]